MRMGITCGAWVAIPSHASWPRPLLIKGLEYDYAVVADVSRFDAHELYASMTRGSRVFPWCLTRRCSAPRVPAGSRRGGRVRPY